MSKEDGTVTPVEVADEQAASPPYESKVSMQTVQSMGFHMFDWTGRGPEPIQVPEPSEETVK